MQKFSGLIRRCADDYDMLLPGDRVAVGLSGGKDSIALLAALNELRQYHPSRFSLFAITADSGFPGMDFTPVADYCAAIGVPYFIEKTDIADVVFSQRQEANPCSLCSKMRRGVINRRLSEEGIGKLALGHHLDDAIDTFFMSLLYEGRLGCFSPVTLMDRTGITQIRPMLYATEDEALHITERYYLPVVPSACPMDGHSSREDIKALTSRLTRENDDFRAKMLGAMQRLPLPGWSPDHKPRVKTRP